MECPWAISEPDPGAHLKRDSDKMMRKKPAVPLEQFVVRAQIADVCEGRDSLAILLNGAAPRLEQGERVESDFMSWSAILPSLRVRLVLPNKLFGSGFYWGWVDYDQLTPLDASGAALPEPTVVNYTLTRAIQTEWERGYAQRPIQEAIREAVATGLAQKKSYRESCNASWLLVRAPVLARYGFAPSMDGLERFMSLPRDYDDAELSDDDWTALKDAHNRLVNLMINKDPALATKVDVKDREKPPTDDSALDETLTPMSLGDDDADVAALGAAQTSAPPAPAPEPEPPLTMERLEDIRIDCCATDIEIDASMLKWTAAEAEAYFESGGTERPEGK
jgi:hypothetical protein